MIDTDIERLRCWVKVEVQTAIGVPLQKTVSVQVSCFLRQIQPVCFVTSLSDFQLLERRGRDQREGRCSEPSTEPVRRFEVFTGSGR